MLRSSLSFARFILEKRNYGFKVVLRCEFFENLSFLIAQSQLFLFPSCAHYTTVNNENDLENGSLSVVVLGKYHM